MSPSQPPGHSVDVKLVEDVRKLVADADVVEDSFRNIAVQLTNVATGSPFLAWITGQSAAVGEFKTKWSGFHKVK